MPREPCTSSDDWISAVARADVVARYNRSPKRRAAQARYDRYRRPLRRLQRRIVEKADLICQLEAQLGLTPQEESS